MSPFWILLKQDNGDDSDYWSYKTCKAPVKLSPSDNPYPVFFYRPDALPSNSVKELKGRITLLIRAMK